MSGAKLNQLARDDFTSKMRVLYTVLQAHQAVPKFSYFIAFLGRTAPALQQSNWMKYQLKSNSLRNMQ